MMATVMKQGMRAIVAMTVAATVSMTWLTSTSTPASAATPCSGSSSQSGLYTGDCSTTGANGGHGSAIKHGTILYYTGKTCTVTNYTPNYQSREAVEDFGTYIDPSVCVRIPAMENGGVSITNTATLALKAPPIETDYKGKFLTGAEVTFSPTSLQMLDQAIDGFDGYTLHAVPDTVTLDFGDGTSQTWDWDAAKTAPITHTYTSTTPDPTKPNDHTVHVKLTVNWDGYLNGPDGAATPLGNLPTSQTLDQPIVEVWSALTETTNV